MLPLLTGYRTMSDVALFIVMVTILLLVAVTRDVAQIRCAGWRGVALPKHSTLTGLKTSSQGRGGA